jgi:hypothetical protein
METRAAIITPAPNEPFKGIEHQGKWMSHCQAYEKPTKVPQTGQSATGRKRNFQAQFILLRMAMSPQQGVRHMPTMGRE